MGTTPISLGLSWPLTKKPPFGSGDRHLLSPWTIPKPWPKSFGRRRGAKQDRWLLLLGKNLQNFLGGELHVFLKLNFTDFCWLEQKTKFWIMWIVNTCLLAVYTSNNLPSIGYNCTTHLVSAFFLCTAYGCRILAISYFCLRTHWHWDLFPSLFPIEATNQFPQVLQSESMQLF